MIPFQGCKEIKPLEKPAVYQTLADDLKALLESERDRLANCANASALLFHSLPDLNWAGFYFFDGRELVLGPFQGKPACVRIALDRGVCGKAASDRKTVVVEVVHRFPGHIACDPDSRSEIVVPLLQNDRLFGVLDMDSPTPGRFDNEDRVGLERFAQLLLEGTDF